MYMNFVSVGTIHTWRVYWLPENNASVALTLRRPMNEIMHTNQFEALFSLKAEMKVINV